MKIAACRPALCKKCDRRGEAFSQRQSWRLSSNQQPLPLWLGGQHCIVEVSPRDRGDANRLLAMIRFSGWCRHRRHVFNAKPFDIGAAIEELISRRPDHKFASVAVASDRTQGYDIPHRLTCGGYFSTNVSVFFPLKTRFLQYSVQDDSLDRNAYN
ncbi:hypothetical protein [Rhizobium leguminosarum]|uniref:hypothetical protein n=1 Tax=Rhizobium leguminosarum TaxID=384 RepID=UPI001F1FD264|nr:hypothetical protein [Rhizobium leguminosarum]UIK20452.1 hypothetical protein LZK79_26535 [Rhizobium leguminosarum]